MMQWEINPQMVGVAAGGDSEDPRRVTQARWHIIAMSFEDSWLVVPDALGVSRHP